MSTVIEPRALSGLTLLSDQVRRSPKMRDVVVRLQRLVLSSEEGSLIGQEVEVAESLGCTRATLRQACRILEVQGLLETRRGAKGGLYGTRPSVDTVVELAGLYFIGRGTTLEEALKASMAFTIEAVRMACSCDLKSAARTRMIALRGEVDATFPEDLPARDFALQEGAIDEAIFAMAGSAPLELLIRVLNGISVHEFGERLFIRRPERRIEVRRIRAKMIDAILAHDAPTAVAQMEALHGLVEAWLPELQLD